ncbi:chemotaxis-specific protein-glutamate methyltransferase CheB [Algisphaera agarilytica]|uniref:Protein-glutamate methylesterase/protein-glutamine glutaminase n=1 Tax=Algisphaera agarilytica TaxID=1385975 RepID=A0A7X0H672_9BACT|nr:chemotaxis-specific protein-glutamate methyltransferase CheB [Algisphaera agarilytica]MBB6429802.1 two-component system chemotaxis response regulator CheB [Algisphaera agarilytica]
MRILITDDSAFMRLAIGRTLAEQPDFEIVGRACDGREAVRLAKELRPDVITMDIEMPEMDGLTALRRIMREAPTQVLMCSTLTTEGSYQSLQALRLGAADVIPKQLSADPQVKQRFLDDLVRRVRGLGESNRHKQQSSDVAPAVSDALPEIDASRMEMVCIASSTGGPPVLETLLPSLPATLHIPVVVGQHMPRLFTESMSRRLNDICPLPVIHAENGMELEAGKVYIAPGETHTHIERVSLAKCGLRMSDEPRESLYKPSADVLFETAAKVCQQRVLGIILTGIGDDGLKGARALHECGAPLLAQDRYSCVVYGMPRVVAEAGYATASLTPDDIAKTLSGLTARAAA